MKQQKRTNREDKQVVKKQQTLLGTAIDTICNSGKLLISISNSGINLEYDNGPVEFSTRIKNSNNVMRNDTENG